MNAPSLNEIRGTANRDVTDEKLDQIREIVVGDALRTVEGRLNILEHRLNELEVSIARQLDALEARIDALAQSTDGERRATFEALASSVADLSEQIRRISGR